MAINIAKYLDQFESTKSNRSEIEPIWEEVDQIIYGKQKNKQDLQDFTLRRCRNQLASFLQNMIIMPNYPWFGVSVISDYSDGYTSLPEDLWAQDINKILLSVFNNPQNNFTSAIRQFFWGLCAYGTSALMIEENESAPYKAFFKNVDIKECYFEEDLQGLVNIIYKNFKLAVYKVMTAFKDASSNNLKDLNFAAVDNYLYFTAGTYCNVAKQKSDFVYRISYDVKVHSANLRDGKIENKWQKVFKISPSDLLDEKHMLLVTAKVVTKAFNRVWAIGAVSYLTPKMIKLRLKKIAEEKQDLQKKVSDIEDALSQVSALEAQIAEVGASINLFDRKRDLSKNLEYLNKKLAKLSQEEKIAGQQNWYEQEVSDLKFNSILVGEKGSNQLFTDKKYKTDTELVEEFNDPLAGLSIDVNLGLPGKVLWAISLSDSLYKLYY